MGIWGRCKSDRLLATGNSRATPAIVPGSHEHKVNADNGGRPLRPHPVSRDRRLRPMRNVPGSQPARPVDLGIPKRVGQTTSVFPLASPLLCSSGVCCGPRRVVLVGLSRSTSAT